MTKHYQQPAISAPPENAEHYLLDENAAGDQVHACVWEDDRGLWHSCIAWGTDYTDFSEAPHRSLAIRDVLETYRMNYREMTD